ncbi:hypothetical protein RSP03_17100 [Cereibacter sphaeroides]|nr:hypothetical protein RSP03_17100 [Cereibacter sphaeroides]
MSRKVPSPLSAEIPAPVRMKIESMGRSYQSARSGASRGRSTGAAPALASFGNEFCMLRDQCRAEHELRPPQDRDRIETGVP